MPVQQAVPGTVPRGITRITPITSKVMLTVVVFIHTAKVFLLVAY